jgi:hypothetical protein
MTQENKDLWLTGDIVIFFFGLLFFVIWIILSINDHNDRLNTLETIDVDKIISQMKEDNCK